MPCRWIVNSEGWFLVSTLSVCFMVWTDIFKLPITNYIATQTYLAFSSCWRTLQSSLEHSFSFVVQSAHCFQFDKWKPKHTQIVIQYVSSASRKRLRQRSKVICWQSAVDSASRLFAAGFRVKVPETKTPSNQKHFADLLTQQKKHTRKSTSIRSFVWRTILSLKGVWYACALPVSFFARSKLYHLCTQALCKTAHRLNQVSKQTKRRMHRVRMLHEIPSNAFCSQKLRRMFPSSVLYIIVGAAEDNERNGKYV